MDSYTLEQNLKCPICLTIAEEPNETSCCGHIFCAKCITSITLKMNCPICRSNKFFFRQNSFVKLLLNTSQVACPNGCGSSILLSQLKLHRYTCEASLFKCSIDFKGEKCKFEGTRIEALTHFISSHSDHFVVLAENYSSFKNTFNKFNMIDKILKQEKAKLDKNIFISYKEDEDLNGLLFNSLNYKKDNENLTNFTSSNLNTNTQQQIKKDN
jgi:hypothetical protein